MATRRVSITIVEAFVIAVLFAAVASLGLWWHSRASDTGHLETMKDDLRNLATAQEAYAADNGGVFMPRNSRVTSTLPYNGYAPSAGVTVNIGEPAQSGWSATATHALAPGRICGMFEGESPADPSNPATISGEPGCS